MAVVLVMRDVKPAGLLKEPPPIAPKEQKRNGKLMLPSTAKQAMLFIIWDVKKAAKFFKRVTKGKPEDS